MSSSNDRDTIHAFTQANRAVWEASAPLHGSGDGWDDLLLAACRPGFSVLDECLTATLTALDVSGRTAVQVGCNNARELISLASLGAIPALGIDQSAAFLAQAAQLARAAGLSPRLLEADIYNLPEDVGRFDVVLITIGVLNWMPDLERFFCIVRGLMNPDALLVIYETHPILDMFDPQSATPLVPCTSYFDKAPIEVDDLITYDGSDGGKGETGYWFVQTLGEIVTACVSSGMALQRLEEHPHSNREVDYGIYEHQVAQLPLCYTLVARATA